jgi:hypothetical protein
MNVLDPFNWAKAAADSIAETDCAPMSIDRQ